MVALTSRLFRHKCFVRCPIEQLSELRRVGEFDLDDPGFVRCFVDLVWSGLQLFVDGCHGPTHRRKQVADSFDAFDRAERIVGGHRVAYLGHVDVNNIAQRVLRVVRNADGPDLAVERNPLVFARVATVRGISHRMTCSFRIQRSFSVRLADGARGMRKMHRLRGSTPNRAAYFGGPKPGYGCSGTSATISSIPALKIGRLAMASRTSASAAASHRIEAPGVSPRSQTWRRIPAA